MYGLNDYKIADEIDYIIWIMYISIASWWFIDVSLNLGMMWLKYFWFNLSILLLYIIQCYWSDYLESYLNLER